MDLPFMGIGFHRLFKQILTERGFRELWSAIRKQFVFASENDNTGRRTSCRGAQHGTHVSRDSVRY